MVYFQAQLTEERSIVWNEIFAYVIVIWVVVGLFHQFIVRKYRYRDSKLIIGLKFFVPIHPFLFGLIFVVFPIIFSPIGWIMGSVTANLASRVVLRVLFVNFLPVLFWFLYELGWVIDGIYHRRAMKAGREFQAIEFCCWVELYRKIWGENQHLLPGFLKKKK